MKRTSEFLMVIFVAGSILTSCSSGTNKNKSSDNQKDEVESAWKIVQVKDEFGDIIKNESTIAADFKGIMSNTAVTDAALTVRMQIKDSTIYSMFFEYNKEPQAQLPDTKYIYIKVKTSSGEVLEVKQFLFNNMMIDNDKELLNILLKQNHPAKVIVDLSKVDKYSLVIYNFEIDPNGLKEVVK